MTEKDYMWIEADGVAHPLTCLPGETDEDAIRRWGNWMQSMSNRRIALDEIGNIRVSTVFLGVDHDFGGKGPPILYETMVFGGTDETERDQWRYSTRSEAEAGHAQALASVRPKP